MAVNINKPTVEILSKTSNSVTYRCTCSMNATSYFGLCDTSRHIVTKKANSYGNYIGWPIRNKWKEAWHASPDSKLTNNQYWNGPKGNLQCMLIDRSISWEETVSITTGNSRTGSKSITVGIESTSTDSRFPTQTTTVTLTTTSIPEGTIKYFEAEADSGDVVGNRYIRFHCEFTNPENYHTCKLLNSSGDVIASSNGTTLDHTILITESMYNTTKVYKVVLYGKDNVACKGAKEKTVSIDQSGVGVYVIPDSSNILDTKKVTIKNVNFKDIKEVWVFKNNKWHKTKK